MNFIYYYTSLIGTLILHSDGEFLKEIVFSNEVPKDNKEIKLKIFEETKEWLDIYFEGQTPSFTPKMKPEGTEFQLAVWEILKTIPFGKTMTYGEIAKMFSAKMSAQAIGGAVSKNKIPIIIPCHRVLGNDSKLTGFSGGLWRKEKLLELEGIKYK